MKKIISILMVTILTFSLSMTAFAKEENTEELEVEVSKDMMRLLTEEEALEAGFTAEEIKGRDIYEVKTTYEGTIPAHLYSGDVAYEDVTASNSFTGAGHTIHANKAKVAISIRGGTGNLFVGFYSYNSNWPGGGMIYHRSQDPDSWQSDWFSIYSNDTYYFRYWVSTISGADTDIPIKFRIVLAAV